MGSLRVQKGLVGQGQRPALMPCTLCEAFSNTATDAGTVAFVLSRLSQANAPILWIQDRLSRKESGRLYLSGIGVKRSIIMVDLSRAADVLWAMEDGLRCRALGGVIGEVWGDPTALDFTATKRLALRAEAADVPCWLIRRAASPDLSAARDRWRIASLPSAQNPYDARSPGLSRLSVELFRSRNAKPNQWVASYDQSSDRFNLASPLRDGTMEPRDGTARQRAAG